MHEQLVALEELAKIDLGFRQLEVERDEVRGHLEESRTNVERIRELLQREKDQLAASEKLRVQRLREVEELGERQARSSARHNQSKNNREREATQREMEGFRREREERSKEATDLARAVEEVRGAIGKHEQDFARLQEELAAEEKDTETQLATIESRRGELDATRRTATVKVRADLLRRYDSIRARKGTAVAEVSGGTCRACHIALPPQMYARLHAGTEIIQCPSCQRILVLRALVPAI